MERNTLTPLAEPRRALPALLLLALTACTQQPVKDTPQTTASGPTPAPSEVSPAPKSNPAPESAERPSTVETYASYYANLFHGRQTASGTIFDQNEMVAAHRRWPFGTVVKVTNLDNDKSVVVNITDRGPYGANYRKGVTIDLSRAAATQLDMLDDGVVEVKLDILHWGDEDTASADTPASGSSAGSP